MTRFFIRALNKLNLLDNFKLSTKVTLNNKGFKIPLIGKVGLANLFMSEPWMIDLLKAIVPLSKGTFVDVGVNVGQTLLKLKSVSPDTGYIGFEPNPNCVYYVNSLIQLNQFDKIELVPVGISTKTELGKLHFYSNTETDSAASIVEDFRPDERVARSEYIPVFSFEEIARKVSLGDISIVKIDVEGGELEVLQSLEAHIMAKNPFILIEILPVYTKENVRRLERQNKIEELIRKWDYSINRVKKQNDILVGIAEIQEIGIHKNLNDCEYVLVPRPRQELFAGSFRRITAI
jgi:FkbM family methyltransferase